jgi:GNAT superfamily N-acetyltransferase
VKVDVRTAEPDDATFLQQALMWAANWRGSPTSGPPRVDPAIARYLTSWPREGDFGVVAEDETGPIGAAWCRIFSADEPGCGYVAPDIPEVTIAVVPSKRGGGVGTALLDALIDRARSNGVAALSLSVEDGNEAVRLYERVGFRPTHRAGKALTMRLDLR